MEVIAFRGSVRFLICTVCSWSMYSVAFGSEYTIRDVGALGIYATYAGGINASGQVVGLSTRPFRTNATGMIDASSDLGGGPDDWAHRINDAGQVVGEAVFTPGMNGHAFRTESNGGINSATDLGTLGGNISFGYDINASGQVVGSAQVLGLGSANHAFRTTANGKIDSASDLGSLIGASGNSYAYGINSSGQVVGISDSGVFGVPRAFRTTANGVISAASDLGSLGGNFTLAYDINDSGRTVGYSRIAGNFADHAFRTAPNGMIDLASDLGTLGGNASYGVSINSSGQTVGSSFLAGNQGQHAFVTDLNGKMVDLNTLIPADSGWTLIGAGDINNFGQITAFGTHNGVEGSVVLAPVAAPLVPEPGCLGLVAMLALPLFRKSIPQVGRSKRR